MGEPVNIEMPTMTLEMAGKYGIFIFSQGRLLLTPPVVKAMMAVSGFVGMLTRQGRASHPELQLYDTVEPTDLLMSCRGAAGNKVAAAKAVSWLATFYAWMVLVHRPAMVEVTRMLCPAVDKAAVEQLLEEVAASVDNVPIPAAYMQDGEYSARAKAMYRGKKARSLMPRLVSASEGVFVLEHEMPSGGTVTITSEQCRVPERGLLANFAVYAPCYATME